MTIIPGYGRMAVAFSRLVGKKNGGDLEKNISSIVADIPTGREVDLDMVSFSGSKTLLEQAYCILSFYYNVGQPVSWTVYSDKSHTEQEILFLQAIPRVRVLAWDANLKTQYPQLTAFAKKFPIWSNRMHAYSNYEISRTTIFADSDILFYKGFGNFIGKLRSGNWFIADTGGHFDDYYFETFTDAKPPFVNAGFMVLNKRPDWSVAIAYIFDRPDHDSWQHFTEQASIHHMLRSDPEINVLDPDYFILTCDDSFAFKVGYDAGKIALRHFVSPVRHKMWQTNWRKILGVK